MVSFNDTAFLILGGLDSLYDKMSSVTLHSASNDSTDRIIQPETIVENDANGHEEFYCDGNQVAKVSQDHFVLLGLNYSNN